MLISMQVSEFMASFKPFFDEKWQKMDHIVNFYKSKFI